MDPVVPFEMPYENRERVAKFYQAAFGWKTNMLGAQFGDYVQADTAESDESGPLEPGRINGGFYPTKPDWPAQYPAVVIAVTDLEDAMARVKRLGGKVLGEPMDSPRVGTYVSFTDTEGSRVSLLQPVAAQRAAAGR